MPVLPSIWPHSVKGAGVLASALACACALSTACCPAAPPSTSRLSEIARAHAGAMAVVISNSPRPGWLVRWPPLQPAFLLCCPQPCLLDTVLLQVTRKCLRS